MAVSLAQVDRAAELRAKILADNLNAGESPYYGMYWCGYYGVPLEECLAKCQSNGVPLRQKDIRSYEEGAFKRGVHVDLRGLSVQELRQGRSFDETKLSDLPMFPVGWKGTEKRFFPCTSDNKPMCKWGWSRDYTPALYDQASAKALSPVGWIGQNMLYQRFIVLDIDGRGHGEDDEQVIEFGNLFKSFTFTMEDPAKPGSFHLYFRTDRIVPVRHFPWAKLDMMGNAVNAAVYLKNKKPNGLEPMDLTEEIWSMVKEYVKQRKEGA